MNHFKVLSAVRLQEELHSIGFYACGCKPSLQETWKVALKESASHHAVLVVCGSSFYIMHDIKQLAVQYTKDSPVGLS